MKITSYTIKSYPSNVEIYVSHEDETGHCEGGRIALISCTGDGPQWAEEKDWGNDGSAITDGRKLGSYLQSLTDSELKEWLIANNEGDGEGWL